MLCLPARPADAEVVLLRNGSLLEGTVDRQGEQVVVRSAGSVLRLRAAEVAHTAESKLALYEWRREQAAAGPLTSDDHLLLADWALSNGLAAQAARELLDARQLDPQSRRLALLERRLVESLRPPPAVSPQPTTPAAAPSADPTPEPTAPLPRLPEGSREAFARRVQLLVLNGCGAGNCHGGARSADSFSLDTIALHGVGTARSTEHNLAAVLAAIDLDNPGDSPLLLAARGPHYGATPFEGPRRQELIGVLDAWVGAVAAENQPAPLADAAPAEPEASDPAAPGALPDQATAERSASPAPPPTIAASPVWQPRDEFDPAIFNTRFRRPQDDLPGEAPR